MPSWRLCWPVPKGSVKEDINTPGGRHHVCVDLTVPVLVDRHPPHINWTHPSVSVYEARQLQTLAAIDELAESLPDHISSQILEIVSINMRELGKKIGEGSELTRQ